MFQLLEMGIMVNKIAEFHGTRRQMIAYTIILWFSGFEQNASKKDQKTSTASTVVKLNKSTNCKSDVAFKIVLKL